VPIDGLYYISHHSIWQHDDRIRLRVRRNGTVVGEIYNYTEGSYTKISGSQIVVAQEGDVIILEQDTDDAEKWGTGRASMNYFTGILLYIY